MTFGSLFAGIGGFDLGLERAGMACKWQVEIDPFCRAVLAKHWPDVKRYEDIRTVGNKEWADNRMDDMVRGGCCDGDYPGVTYHWLEAVDVICGGFPCQDISHAGKRAGIDGDRSGLWREMVRVVRLVRPSYLLVENVTALLVGGMGRVLGDLATIGYDAEWDCIPASAMRAPHQRDRVWILAYSNGSRLAQRVVRAGDSGQAGSASTREDAGVARAVSDADHEGKPGRAFNASARASLQEFVGRDEWWRTEPNVGRVAHGVPARVDRLRGLGNAIVPQIAEWLGRRILEADAAHV